MKTRRYLADVLFTAADERAPIENGAVLVDAGKIAAVGPAAAVPAGEDADVEISGALLPGLIDLHTHLCMNAGADPGREVSTESDAVTAARAVGNLQLHLDAGVTTIRDVGGKAGIDLDIMRMVDTGQLEGPQVFAAGNVLCITGGHACFLGMECDGVDAMTQGAREQLKRGAKLLKLIATGGVITPGVQPGVQQLSESEMRAACDVAHLASKRVAAHAQGAEGIEAALRAGVDTIEHGFWLTDDAIAFMVAHDRTLVPTFAALRTMERMADELPAFIQDKLGEISPAQRDSFARARAAGVRIAAGTDAGTPGNPHGNIREELVAFAELRVPSLDVWRTATSNAADALGTPDRGRLAVGLRADMCAVSTAAFEDVAQLRAPLLVVQAGEIRRSTLCPA